MMSTNPDGENPGARTRATTESGSSDASELALLRAQVLTRQAEFSAFYRVELASLVTFLRWQGADISMAAEVAQDTMTKAYQRWESLTAPKAWVRTVAGREFIRRSLEQAPILTDKIAEVGTPTIIRADSDIDAIETKHDVLRLLSILPPRQRQVLAWTYDGYTPTEIASELGIAAETVRSNLKFARRTLAKHLSLGKDQT